MLIDGLNIIEKTKIMSISDDIVNLFTVLIITTGFIAIAFAIGYFIAFVISKITHKWFRGKFDKCDKIILITCSIPIILIIVMSCVCSLDRFKTQFTDRYRYEVTVEDNVTYNELNEKYDIISTGETLIIEDKELVKENK